ncbi:MAG TPA: hypothetical protein VLY21_04410 [Nitrososphaerales archaeon]|nr:hypothetical protein [Nitrososphaerales archaeon]
MRSQLLVAGVLIVVLGAVFYLLEVPLVFFWSVPFVIGGGIMAVASLFMAESQGPVTPPQGYRFCVFCGDPVKIGEDRCPRCNGLQPKVES